MKSSEIRDRFIEFFTQRGHEQVSSSSLIPVNDPTLLFTNAGMVQFKETFLGLEMRPYRRAVSAQRCLRAGGKHNDLENVGYTARHHTFFEMLGNFSFGDYFKQEAIHYAWEFLTQVLKLPPERLWVTVYQDDDEAASIWLNHIGVDVERFSRCGEADNFWSMGDTGPCGPCTEIFYDHGPEIAGGPPGSPDADGDRYIEIWNIVFMQYNRDRQGNLHPLPKPSVDTGMGLERITAVVQGVHTNYQIDSFQHLIAALVRLNPQVNRADASLNVIADHIRACAFLIADGVIPGNEGRGYVLRRIIRRAARHGHKLGLPVPFFSQLVTPLIEVMGEAYPELGQHQAQIRLVLEKEENQFARTLEQGLLLLQQAVEKLSGTVLPGDVAFKLYDTYGFPVDLTSDVVRELGLTVDHMGFEQCMQQQRQQSQAASQFNVDYSDVESLVGEISDFCGYEQDQGKSQIVALLEANQSVPQLSTGARAAVVLQTTPFYAESGGQVGDEGILKTDHALFRVEDTQRVGQAIVHYGVLTQGQLQVGDAVVAEVDFARREATRLNHTATHLLHAALRVVVGEHVQQKGSLVEPLRARFDFTHFQALTPEQIQQVEALVNEKIRANEAVVTTLMSLDEAKQQGAVALFGEKYSDEVRVLSVGTFSKELCGGTHARRTGDIGLFKIIEEYGIASGVRRIEMVSGAQALNWVNQQLAMLDDVALKLKTTRPTTLEKLSQLMQDAKACEKELSRQQALQAAQSGNALLAHVERVGDIQILIRQLEHGDGQVLRTTLDQVKSSLNEAVIVLFTVNQGKMNVVAGVSKKLLGRVPSAADLVKELCGKGGGRADMAQGGGEVPSDLEQRLDRIKTLITA